MPATLEFVSKVLAIGDAFNEYGDLWDCISWRTDGEYAPVSFSVNCSDLFYWAFADCEDLTEENLSALLQAVKDVRKAFGVDVERPTREMFKDHWHAGSIGAELFCCRVRGMRPQRPILEKLDPRVLPLFEACGPPRDPKSEG